MRGIKFRAWDDVTSKMYHTGEEDMMQFYFNSNGIVVDSFENTKIPFEDNLYDDVITETLEHLEYMQYTGLKDSHGKEVFEGDIIEAVFELLDGELKNIMDVGVVVFKDCAFQVQTFEGHYEPLHEWSQLSEELKVIGNIYENPELLQKG